MLDLFGPLTPVLLLAMINGLVEFLKQFGVEGKASLVAAMILGIVLGVVFQLTELYPAVSIWAQVGVYGVLFGLTASGLYDLGKRLSGQ